MSDPFGNLGAQHSSYYNSSYSESENREFTAIFNEITEGFKNAMIHGFSPDSEIVQDLVLKHYQFCCRFWKPNRESYQALAMSYILPSPYRETYEGVAEGLGKYHYDAISHFANNNL